MGLIYKYQTGNKVMNNSEFITTLNNQFIYPMDYNYESSSPLNIELNPVKDLIV